MLFLIIIVSYIIGSIPTGYWLGKIWKGVDVRQHGSGNLGATNVFRVLGKGAGLVTLLIDITKGALPVLWVKMAYPDLLGWAVAAGVAAIIGHTMSIFVRFRGGKGVATSAGAFAALLPIPSFIAFLIFAGCLTITRMVSASSITAAIALALSSFLLSADPLLSFTALVIALLVIVKHRSNIGRIAAGTEPRIHWNGAS
jgi:glycerol-3-phosphate acyltransferase PlsY